MKINNINTQQSNTASVTFFPGRNQSFIDIVHLFMKQKFFLRTYPPAGLHLQQVGITYCIILILAGQMLAVTGPWAIVFH